VLGVCRDARVRQHARLVADRPRVVSELKVHDLAGTDGNLGAVAEWTVIWPDRQMPVWWVRQDSVLRSA
jgi:hypothetical protein